MKDGKVHHNSYDIAGKKYGMLTAVARHHTDGKKWSWVFRCDCGKEVIRVTSDVTKAHKKGMLQSCGCQRHKRAGDRLRTHGMSRHPAFAVWRSMLDRCRLPTHQAWENYGGRGITVCERWQESFQNFWDDMGATYQKGLCLDRRDNEKGYCPENCRWVTYRQSANNKRTSVYIHTSKGRMTVAQASREFGVGVTTILYRISAGWKEEELLITPSYLPKHQR